MIVSHHRVVVLAEPFATRNPLNRQGVFVCEARLGTVATPITADLSLDAPPCPLFKGIRANGLRCTTNYSMLPGAASYLARPTPRPPPNPPQLCTRFRRHWRTGGRTQPRAIAIGPLVIGPFRLGDSRLGSRATVARIKSSRAPLFRSVLMERLAQAPPRPPKPGLGQKSEN